MNKIAELIEKYCPDGVEYKPISDIAVFRRGSFPQPYTNASFYGGEGSMPFVQVADMQDNSRNLKAETKQTISNIAQPKSIFVRKGTILVSIQGTIGRVAITQYDCYVDRTIAIFDDYKIDINKQFFAYQLESKFGEEKKYARGSTLKTITKEEFAQFKIPVPPMEVQEEIVRILDNFTELSAELSAELTARKKQYNFYRDKLLTFENNFEMIKLSDEFNVLRGKRLTKDMLSDNDKYPVFHGGLEPLGYYNQKNRDANSVMIINVGASAGTVGYSNVDFWSSDGCYCLSKNDKADPKFMYHLLMTKQNYLQSKVRKAGIPTLDAKIIEDLQIVIPSLEVQQRIVDVLDNFDKICSDLGIGLPAEIEKRQQQYEYYREKLLTFDNKSATILTDRQTDRAN